VLVPLKLSAAKRRLTKANCRLGSIKRAHSAVAKGLIVSQRPAPKKHLKAKAKVSVTVSLGR
jgi:beta-lactam-binding protein with PASTA domain